MIRVQFLLAACLAMTVLTQGGIQEGVKSLLTSSTHVAQESSQPVAETEHSEKTDPVLEERIQREIADIMAIRKQLGGGVSEQLKGFSIEMPGGKKGEPQALGEKKVTMEEAFAQQLAKQTRNSVDAETKKWSEEQAVAAPARATSAQESVMPPQERRETVRHAARMLEEAAAMLEEASEYDQADKVRQTAGELWRTARMR